MHIYHCLLHNNYYMTESGFINFGVFIIAILFINHYFFLFKKFYLKDLVDKLKIFAI